MAHLHSPEQKQPEADLTRVYDAIVVGSGAAGGMAAHALTARGLQVLLLEAGKKLDIEAGLKPRGGRNTPPGRGGVPPRPHPPTFTREPYPPPPPREARPPPQAHPPRQGR